MCPRLPAEYEDPRDRRFHAQPNACPVCGPRVRLCGWARMAGMRCCRRRGDPATPVRAAAGLCGPATILAVKGLGGFHLACDATNGEAVRRLKLPQAAPGQAVWPSCSQGWMTSARTVG